MANPFISLWNLLNRDLETDVQARSVAPVFPSWEQQLAAFHRGSWGPTSPDQALSVPAIFRAVTLIANTIGMLNLEVYRNGRLLTDRVEAPKVAVRPNPLSTPRVFFRDTAFYMATRGEAWWWIARRDADGIPLSLYPIPPWEITVEANSRNRLEPTVKWMQRTMDLDDLRHITYMPDRTGLRGVGPLQMCGAAISVAVEADNWAANWFSGSIPSIVGSTDMDISPDEAEALDKQWNEKASNMPRWLGLGLKVENFGIDPAKAQLTDVRRFNDGQAAVMFGIPGSLLEYSVPGSSITYQNVGAEYTKLVRTCLQPNYLEPIEQEMSDLLTRSTTARFDVNEVERADIGTRATVYKTLTDAQVTPEVAAHIVGFETIDPNPTNVAPVPFSPPQAVPNQLPADVRSARTSGEVRCDGMVTKRLNGIPRITRCNRLISRGEPFVGPCPRCKKHHEVTAAS